MDGTEQRNLEPAAVDARGELVVAVARHRRHRFPARTESVRARYDRDELAVVAAAAARAGLTASGYVAAIGGDRPVHAGRRTLAGGGQTVHAGPKSPCRGDDNLAGGRRE